jgi:hypothetical protein
MHGKEIKDTVINFLIKSKQLSDTSNFTQNGYNIGLYEILNDEKTKINDYGVFQFSTFSSHSLSYILLYDKDQCEILDTQDISTVLLKLILFLKNNFVSNEFIVKYVKNTILLYENNETAIPWKIRLN